MKKRSKLMRVPVEFENTIKRLSRERKHENVQDFLRTDGIRLFKNAESLTQLVDVFRRRRRI